MNQQGQTAVEYILLLLVIATVAVNVGKVLKERIVGNAGDCTGGNKALICQVQALMDVQGDFKYFKITK